MGSFSGYRHLPAACRLEIVFGRTLAVVSPASDSPPGGRLRRAEHGSTHYFIPFSVVVVPPYLRHVSPRIDSTHMAVGEHSDTEHLHWFYFIVGEPCIRAANVCIAMFFTTPNIFSGEI